MVSYFQSRFRTLLYTVTNLGNEELLSIAILFVSERNKENSYIFNSKHLPTLVQLGCQIRDRITSAIGTYVTNLFFN